MSTYFIARRNFRQSKHCISDLFGADDTLLTADSACSYQLVVAPSQACAPPLHNENTLLVNHNCAVLVRPMYLMGAAESKMSLLDALGEYDKLEYCKALQSYSSDYINNASKVKRFFSYYPDFEITGVSKVQNSFLKVMYDFKKIEYQARYPGSVKEHELFHSTNASSVSSIIKNNFDWRRVSRTKYGMGTSFSTSANYANCHANRQNGYSRAMIICDVLVANKIGGSGSTTIPPRKYDTTGDPQNLVYVKYQDNEFLPKFVVYYDCPDDLISKSAHYTGKRRHHRMSYWDDLLL